METLFFALYIPVQFFPLLFLRHRLLVWEPLFFPHPILRAGSDTFAIPIFLKIWPWLFHRWQNTLDFGTILCKKTFSLFWGLILKVLCWRQKKTSKRRQCRLLFSYCCNSSRELTNLQIYTMISWRGIPSQIGKILLDAEETKKFCQSARVFGLFICTGKFCTF